MSGHLYSRWWLVLGWLATVSARPFRVDMLVSMHSSDPSTHRVELEIDPSWAPKGAARFKQLVESSFYTDCFVHRVVSDFVTQFGISSDPEVNKRWKSKIPDDPFRVQSNRRGTITFATSGPNTRTTQVFINLRDNPGLDDAFAPIGRVVTGMDVVSQMFVTGDRQAPQQGLIESRGKAYLLPKFAELSVIRSATIRASDAAPFVVSCTLQHKQPIRILVHPEWAPLGAARFKELVLAGYLDRTPLHRAVKGFLVQFGKNATSQRQWRRILDDPLGRAPHPFKRGMVSFAGSGPNSRTTEMFISFSNSEGLGKAPWETAFGMLTPDSMAALASINTEYGDMPPWGQGPDPARMEDPRYLKEHFPRVDYWGKCHIEPTKQKATLHRPGERREAAPPARPKPVEVSNSEERFVEDAGHRSEGVVATPPKTHAWPLWYCLVPIPGLLWARYSWSLKKAKRGD